MATELKAPQGKTRVVGVDLFDHGDYLVKDCDTQSEAFEIADNHNCKRSGSMDDVYLAGTPYTRHGFSDIIQSIWAIQNTIIASVAMSKNKF